MTIFAILKGGLGNQLFQYAAARSLSKNLNVNFSLDMSWYSNISSTETIRSVELSNLGLDCPYIKLRPLLPRISRYFDAIHNCVSPIKIIRETPHKFCPHFFNARDNTLLLGYWQSHIYSEPIHNELSSDILKSVNRLSDHSRLILSKINHHNPDCISVHVRRGDYVTSASTNSYHGVLPLSYYHRCFAQFDRLINHPHYFVFSDDINWCKSAFSSSAGDFTFVDCNSQQDSWQDLILMSFCSHHILANSSFSWWSARLGDYLTQRQNMVYYPFRWLTAWTDDISFMFPSHWSSLRH